MDYDLPVLGDTCELCGKDTECTDTRDIEDTTYVLCRDCAMAVDDDDKNSDD